MAKQRVTFLTIGSIAFIVIALLLSPHTTNTIVAAQERPGIPLLDVKEIDPKLATDAALFASEAARLASPSAEELKQLEEIKKEDITTPEKPEEKSEIFELFAKRPVTSPTFSNFFAFVVQTAVREGVPANTIILILLLPFLATGIAFFRHLVGLPTLGILVPTALSITLVSTGIGVGTLLLATILVASFLAQALLRKIRIMHMPKLALSMLMVSVFVFAALVVGVYYGALTVKNLSIFPVLLLILLSERIVALQLERQLRDTLSITLTSLSLGIGGFFILSSVQVQQFILLYPELILLLIPINIAIGRYFGLRLIEFFRFRKILDRYGR